MEIDNENDGKGQVISNGGEGTRNGDDAENSSGIGDGKDLGNDPGNSSRENRQIDNHRSGRYGTKTLKFCLGFNCIIFFKVIEIEDQHTYFETTRLQDSTSTRLDNNYVQSKECLHSGSNAVIKPGKHY